jgi:hypothetical protein
MEGGGEELGVARVLAGNEPVTAEWLTEALAEGGALPRGEVATVTPRANDAFNSAAVHLAVTYSPDAPAPAPRRLFLKRNIDAAWGRDAGKSEVAFYHLVATYQRGLPMIVPCYSAEYDPESGDSHCLLLDVSETHVPPTTRDALIALRGVPSAAALDQAVGALAAFHAFWWEHPSLGREPVTEVTWWYRDEEHFAAHVVRRRREWDAFIAAEGDWFPAELRALYERVLDRMPVLWDRYIGPRVMALRHLTLGHGDCYLTQFLCPRDGATGPTYLIDWQGAGTDFNGFDLVHLFGFWTAAQRRVGNRQERLLRRYHAGLLAHGVRDYSWEDLLGDFRLMLTILLLYPVWDETNGSARSYWWPKMQCFSDAYRELDCEELLARR